MDNLKIGDKLYRTYTKNEGYDKNTYYEFADVVRLTNTLAILSNGVRLKNIPLKPYTLIYFNAVGKYHNWQKITPEVIAASEKLQEKQIIDNWFLNHGDFTDEEKKIIYNTLKNK